MLSAGNGFFCRSVLLRLHGGGIAPALHEQIDLRYKVCVGNKRYQSVILLRVTNRREEDIRLGIFAEVL